MNERTLHIPDRIREVVREPNWYDRMDAMHGGLLLGAMAVGNVTQMVRGGGRLQERGRRLLVQVFEQLLEEGAVTLGQAGPNWDEDRKPIDTVVVHHTSRSEPVRLSELNALHLLRLYVPKYRNPGEDAELIGGKPIYSGHSDEQGRQVFYGYHWLVRADGTRERLLPDEAIGWHAGNWDVNTRSVGVCFDDDLEHRQPTSDALRSVSELVAEQYPSVESRRILGHGAIVSTACPGNDFEEWGAEIRALVEAAQA